MNSINVAIFLLFSPAKSLAQQAFAMLGLIASLQHQLSILSLSLRARRGGARDGAFGAELRQDELLHVVHRALHHAANLREVHPGNLPRLPKAGGAGNDPSSLEKKEIWSF